MKGAALAVVAVLLGCGSGTAPSPRVLVWARSADSATLDPAEAEWGEDLKVTASLFETLVAVSDDLRPEPRLARSWTVEGTLATFELRAGVRFHDGTPLTAEAVAFTFARILDPGHPHRPKVLPYASNFRDIAKVEAVGPLEVRFTLRAPAPLLPFTLSLPGAAIVSPEAVRRHGGRFAQNPAGTGPYRLGRWERDVKMELEAFPEYWGPRPAVPRLIVVPVASPQTAVEKLRRGEVHAVDHPAPGDLEALGSDARTKVVLQKPMTVCCLGFNLRKAPYDDVRLRRAVALAVDRRALVAFAYRGFAEPAWNVVPPAVWGGAPAAEERPDPEAARRLVEQLPPEARRVELIHVNIPRPYMPDPPRVAEFLKDSLRKVGLEVRVSGFDKSAYGVKTRDPAHPMFLLGWKGDYPDPDNYFYPLLHGDNAGDQNGSFFADAGFDDAVSRARAEADPAARRALYARALARYRELLPTLPLVHVSQVVALGRDVQYRGHPFEYRFSSLSMTK